MSLQKSDFEPRILRFAQYTRAASHFCKSSICSAARCVFSPTALLKKRTSFGCHCKSQISNPAYCASRNMHEPRHISASRRFAQRLDVCSHPPLCLKKDDHRSSFLRKGWDSNPRSVISRTHDFQSCALDQLSHLCVCCVYLTHYSLPPGIFPTTLNDYTTVRTRCQVFFAEILAFLRQNTHGRAFYIHACFF